MAIASASKTLCIRFVGNPDTDLRCIYYCVFLFVVYFITGTGDKEIWEGCHGQGFCIIYSPVFF